MSDGEILVEIHAAAVNRADLMQREGNYPPPAGWPGWMGLEIGGIVKELSSGAAAKSRWKPGDRVCALLGGGGYAEAVSVPWDLLMPVPRGLSLTEAAALPEVYATSYLNLFIEGNLEAGQTVFIPAGASGLASAAIPMAKAFGAYVITSVLTDELAVAIKGLGADLVINSSKQKVCEVFKERMETGHPVNIAMDCLAGQDVGDSLPYMAKGGYWILLSVLAGPSAVVSFWPLITGGVHLVGSTLRSRMPEIKARILRELTAKVWPRIEDGTICPKIFAVVPVTEAEKAHDLLRDNRHIGKVVLQVRGGNE
jgi:putative PIG3 family NAD(P)H quinone oxidoreductase